MEVYKSETEEVLSRFLGRRLSFPACIAALDAALAGLLPRLRADELPALRGCGSSGTGCDSQPSGCPGEGPRSIAAGVEGSCRARCYSFGCIPRRHQPSPERTAPPGRHAAHSEHRARISVRQNRVDASAFPHGRVSGQRDCSRGSRERRRRSGSGPTPACGARRNGGS